MFDLLGRIVESAMDVGNVESIVESGLDCGMWKLECGMDFGLLVHVMSMHMIRSGMCNGLWNMLKEYYNTCIVEWNE